MVNIYKVEGYEACKKQIENLASSGKQTVIIFCGSDDINTGESWCPDCVDAAPVINSVVDSLKDDINVLYVQVGDRSYWKDQNNDFRKDPELRLKSVPTLLKYGTSQKLEELEQCLDSNLVKKIFEDSPSLNIEQVKN